MSIKLLSLFHAFGESDSKILGSVEIINSQLIGTGACLPDFVLTNAMLEHMVDTNDEWIVQRTGVRERRIAKNMHTWELALGAAQDALADAKIDAGELDLILVSTCTPDTNTPNTAAILQDKLGAGAIGAFDINNACTGFVSATDIADCYIKSGKARTVLVVSAETLSRIVDYTDRGTCILFGDGAAAAVYRATEDDNLGIQSTFIAADGSGAEYLRMEALPVEDPFAEDRTVDPKARFLKMQGAAVVRFTAPESLLMTSTGSFRIRPTCAFWTLSQGVIICPRKRFTSTWTASATPPRQACRSALMRCAETDCCARVRPSSAPVSAAVLPMAHLY